MMMASYWLDVMQAAFPQSLDSTIDKGRKVISISFLNIFSPPVVSRNDTAALRRTATTTNVQHPVRLCCKQCIVHGGFFSRLQIPPSHQRCIITHPGTRVTGMIHGAIRGSSDLGIFHQMQVFINLDGVVELVSTLKHSKLRICHHHAADNANDFTSFDRLTRKHPGTADG